MNNWYNYTLKEMKIKEDLTMEDIYNAINDNCLIKKEITGDLIIKLKNKYDMFISYKSLSNIRFGIDDRSFNIFLIPLKYKIITNDKKEINVDIVSISQIAYIINSFAFNTALIYCPQCNKTYYGIKYENLKQHEKHLDVCIKESIIIKQIPENSFKNFFKERFNFEKEDIEPLKYEPNFKLYFKHSEYILKNDKIKFFYDKYQNRMKLIDIIDDRSKPLRHFFGQHGKGKTFCLIGILKYLIDHKFIGTFYINCKALSTLNEPIEIKQLIIDEIPFLFYDNYDDYSKCAKKIINYCYDKKNSSFFDLINIVIEQILISQNRKELYIIVFDQYKDNFDKDGKQIESLYNKLILKKDDKIKETTFCLLTFSSMNNNDIRKYKIKYIQRTLSDEINNSYPFYEIANLEYDLSIDDGGIYDINLQKLGNGLKYYNILNYYYSHKEDEEMEKFMQFSRAKIRDNLLDFFNIDKNIKLQNESSLAILGSFSTDVAYNKDNLLNIINNIPFKYFDVINIENEIEKNPEDDFENENENIEQYKIIFCFPLVGEVINEIYNDIINLNPNIYNNLTKSELDGGAKGKFFEKIVTYYLNIESTINKEKKYIDYFEDYQINFHDQVEVLVLNDNEDQNKISFKKHLKNGIYLISQKRYNGKSLDIALLKVSDENSEIIGIQISIRKNKIFNYNQIVDSLSNLKQNIYKYYYIDVEEKDLFFCYIFDWNNFNKHLIRKCEGKGLKYFFFDLTNNCFKDNDGRIIRNLKLNLLSYLSICPESKKSENINYTIPNFFPVLKNEIKHNILNGPSIQPNEKQLKSIKKYLKSNLKLGDKWNIEYQFSLLGFHSDLLDYGNSFCLTKYEGKKKNPNSIVLHVKSLRVEVKENGQIYSYSQGYSKVYDYYIVTKSN